MAYSTETFVNDDQKTPVLNGNETWSCGNAMLHDTTPWAESFHNLRYGLDHGERQMPEHLMDYQGPAEHKTELDYGMTECYNEYHQDLCTAEYLWQNLEERQDELAEQARLFEIEREKQHARRAMILERSRLKAVATVDHQEFQQVEPFFEADDPISMTNDLAGRPAFDPASPIPLRNGPWERLPQQTTASYNGSALQPTSSTYTIDAIEHSQFHLPHHGQDMYTGANSTTPESSATNQTIRARDMQVLDKSITESPTYRFSPMPLSRFAAGGSPTRRHTVPATPSQRPGTISRVNPNGRGRQGLRASTLVNAANAEGHKNYSFMASVQNTQQAPSASGLKTHHADAYHPDMFANLPDIDDDLNAFDTNRDEASFMPAIAGSGDDGSASTSSLSPVPTSEDDDDESLPPQSPTLSDMIGSETPSEDDGEDQDDGEDGDFNPKASSPPPPAHHSVRAFGMRTRRSSGRGK